LGSDPVNSERYQRDPQKARPWVKRHYMTYKPSKSVQRCYVWTRASNKKDTERNPTVANWLFTQTTHVVAVPYGFVCVVTSQK